MNSPNRERIINIPNLFSISRILLIPIFLYMILNRNNIGALIVFFIAASTDMLDGIAARLLNQKTKLGALLDPIGDKALILAVYTPLQCPCQQTWFPYLVISTNPYPHRSLRLTLHLYRHYLVKGT